MSTSQDRYYVKYATQAPVFSVLQIVYIPYIGIMESYPQLKAGLSTVKGLHDSSTLKADIISAVITIRY